jgi:glycosyltransferase involved in cell wall biosynthesis
VTPAPAPTLSIIVPSLNQGRFLRHTLDSIVHQSAQPREIWVIDGGSGDDTVAILKEYQQRHPALHWISEPDSGPADAVNKGLARVTGDIVGIQSSDDVYRAGALAEAIRAFAAEPGLGLVYGDAEIIDADGRVVMRPLLPPFSHEAAFCMRLSIPQSSAFFRRDLALRLEGWRGRYFGCDVDFWMRLIFAAPARKIDRVLSGWRQHAGQRTAPNRRAWDDYWTMIDESDDLRAAAPSVRRAARASRHILGLYLHPTGNPWAMRWHALCALVTYPRFVRYVPRHRFYPLAPGYALARRLRRWLAAANR